MTNKSILSILSHVAHGYVGNRATVFPLQYCGWDVDGVNTTNFSNHPGYGRFAGSASSPHLVDELLQGLKEIGNFNEVYSLILTGYTPSAGAMQVIYDHLIPVYAQQGAKHPAWIVDPVLGDNGRLYVPEDVVPMYKKYFGSGHVSLITPNQFEFEVLSDTKLSDWSDVRSALVEFHRQYHIPYVVISSVVIDGEMYSVGFAAGSKDKPSIFYFPVPQIDCSFNGCGDLFTALVANAFYNNNRVLGPEVLAEVLPKLAKILRHSYDAELAATGQPPSVVRDIRVVSLRHHLLEPAGDGSLVKFLD
ncbi:Ribokinase-like protein [Suhomyces tanzawaensis NRRL Y-17324]|uniref:pyridoxal kinase n=1 Tax=Suhomyces tanzawaensis NRRL Y-17324 TaxID=984487 RepID=A0A1E4SQU8_9ASCO|nr:Ribokinase-like protein [Suhomyces tanzawaensis NRRL Y-17324]ODV81868.1 Ribokinase-like protein [Suhomyces tanzawaensis NRRL Y-17324]